MKNYKNYLFLLFILTINKGIAQQLITYPSEPYTYSQINPNYNPSSTSIPQHSATVDNPSLIAKVGCDGIDPSYYTIGHNNDFTVRVKKENDLNWIDLFEYNTFVNSSSGDLSGVTRSSFVQFDYSGSVVIEITCNNFNQFSIAGKVLIRPQSRVINQSIDGNVLTLTLTAPTTTNSSNGKSYSDKLSVELNGNRYKNLQIFANSIQNYPIPSGPNLIVFDKANNGTPANIYNKSFDSQSKKIIIKDGAIVIVPFSFSDASDNYSNIRLVSNDEIYIEGGGVLKGGVYAENANSVKIYGRGMIDLTNFPKQYSSNNPNRYHYNQGITLRNCTNVTLDGLVINDSQQLCVEIKDCGGLPTSPPENININNLKLFSRVIWGDGFHMKGTSNVLINDCFARTSDDAIAIYASRLPDDTSNRDAQNIRVTNTILYADSAHDIVIGWHGNRTLNYGNNIYNLNFDNIDILEHDQNWIEPSGYIHSEYDGAIGIVCSDDNKCDTFLFSNIRVEDFTNGSVLAVRVMPAGYADAVTSGQYVRNVRFENFDYKGSGEHKSIIQGIDCNRYVDGIHFQNFKINNKLITKLADYTLPLGQVESYPIVIPPNYNTSGFDVNQYAYNITFEEANNYSTSLAEGYYTIKSASSQTNFLKNTFTTPTPFVTSNTNLIDGRVWHIVNVDGTGQYRIHPADNDTKTLQNSFIITQPIIQPQPNGNQFCNGRYLTIEDDNTILTNQEWKIVPISFGSSTYKIINAYTRSYITFSTAILSSNTVALPKVSTTVQNWIITPAPGYISKISNANKLLNSSSNQELKEIVIFPNPTKDNLNINNVTDYKNSRVNIIDINGKVIITESLRGENSNLNVENLSNGIYIVKIIRDNNDVYSQKFVKN